MIKKFIIGIILLFMFAGTSWGQSVWIWQPDSVGGKDALVLSNNANTNYEMGLFLYAYDDLSPWIGRSFIKFTGAEDSVASTSTIDSVRIVFHRYGGVDDLTDGISVHYPHGSWDETTITWNNQPSYSVEDTTFTNIASADSSVYIIITDIYKNWFDGDSTNNGVLIKSIPESGGANRGMYVRSSDYVTNVLEDPQIEVYYTAVDVELTGILPKVYKGVIQPKVDAGTIVPKVRSPE